MLFLFALRVGSYQLGAVFNLVSYRVNHLFFIRQKTQPTEQSIRLIFLKKAKATQNNFQVAFIKQSLKNVRLQIEFDALCKR
jgi:hypothetical protein